MDIMELGAIGELVGGVAVIGSLIYVGLQVRQSNHQNSSESTRALMLAYNGVLKELSESSFADLFRRGSYDYAALPRTDQTRLSSWLERTWRISY